MEKHIYDDKNGIDYTLYGDYYLPNLIVGNMECSGKLILKNIENHIIRCWFYRES